MPLRDLLVHIDASKHCPARLQVAAALAGSFDAHLDGLYVMPSSEISAVVADQFSREALDAADAKAASHRDGAKVLFDRCVKEAGVAGDWINERGGIEGVVTRYARHRDLTILGQVDPDERRQSDALSDPAGVALRAGRPILMVPYAGSFATVGERILVAWNESPQAARAVNDALPLLVKATQVTVLTIGQADVDDASGKDIVRHLRRHGVTVELEQLTGPDMDVSDLLLSRASDETVDLIVMGLYSHSRLREQVLGGVSLHMLQHMTVPALMSH